MHYRKDMITHSTSFDKPVYSTDGTSWWHVGRVHDLSEMHFNLEAWQLQRSGLHKTNQKTLHIRPLDWNLFWAHARRTSRRGHVKWCNNGAYGSMKIDGLLQLYSILSDISLPICESQLFFSQWRRLGHQRPCHVISCLFCNACKKIPVFLS